LIWHAVEVRTLIRFRRRHHDVCWHGADPPQTNAEVDDPIFALVGKAGWVQPHLRGLGGFEAPEVDCEEPARTERVLSRAFSWKLWQSCGGKEERAGDVLETLPMWLDDSNEKRGIYFTFVQMGLQLAIAICTGILFAHPWIETSVGGYFNMGALIFFQCMMLLWVAQPTANDAYTRALSCACYAVELVATSLILASNIIGSAAADDDVDKIEFSLSLAGISAQLLVWACFVPMFFTGYDSFIVPVVQTYWKSEVGWAETACQVIMSLILLPIGILGQLMGVSGGKGMELFASVEGALVANVAAALEGGNEEGTDDEGDDDDAKAKLVAVLIAAASARTTKAHRSKVAVKRLKRTAFLSRVRGTSSDVDEPNHSSLSAEEKLAPSTRSPTSSATLLSTPRSAACPPGSLSTNRGPTRASARLDELGSPARRQELAQQRSRQSDRIDERMDSRQRRETTTNQNSRHGASSAQV